MAVTSKNLRSAQERAGRWEAPARRARALIYGVTLLLAALAIYLIVGVILSRVAILLDDLRYGRPRTMQVDALVGHGDAPGHPTHLLALNLNRQVVLVELPGGDAAQARAFQGPYLFGAGADLAPVTIDLHDADRDGQLDVLLSVRAEQIVYLNRDGAFRPATAEEQAQLPLGSNP